MDNHAILSNDKLRSESLNLLRFPLAVVVVLVHVFTLGEVICVRGQAFTPDAYPVYVEINRFIDGFLRAQSVPIYFFISGYVFFLGLTPLWEAYKRKLKNRVKSLLIPYIVWNALAILQVLVLSSALLRPIFPGSDQVELNLSLSGFLNCFWDAADGIVPSRPGVPLNIPLWFVRNLMVVVLCTPGIYYVLKHTRHYLVALLGIVWYFSPFIPWLEKDWITSFFFFSWGAYMSINKKDMLVEFGRLFRLSVILYVSLSLLYVAASHWFQEATTVIKQLNVLVGLIFAYNLSSWLLRRNICRPNAFLASASFFIYVAHGLVCGHVRKLLYFVMQPASDVAVIVLHTSALMITVGGLLFVFWTMRRYTPKLLNYITGKK